MLNHPSSSDLFSKILFSRPLISLYLNTRPLPNSLFFPTLAIISRSMFHKCNCTSLPGYQDILFVSSFLQLSKISTYCETTDYTVEGAVGGNRALKVQIQCPGSSLNSLRYRYASNIPWLKAGWNKCSYRGLRDMHGRAKGWVMLSD